MNEHDVDVNNRSGDEQEDEEGEEKKNLTSK